MLQYRAFVTDKNGNITFTSSLNASRSDAAIEAFRTSPKVKSVRTERANTTGECFGFSIEWIERYQVKEWL
jgi:hypothetical protein